MDVQNIAELVVAIAVAVVPIIGAYVVKLLKANKFVALLAPLAHDAVVAVQKLGMVSYIEGEAKKSKAVEFVVSALTKLGFKKADLTTIQNAVEDEYSKAIAELNVVYPQMTEEQEKQAAAQAEAKAQAAQAAATAKAKSDALAAAQKAATDAQANLAKLQAAN
ncbi:phage holin [Oenococcus oeni]|uniref:phage holin n=5 Tax=Oenococcus oeni TaxID=1247 RepID=UPI00029788B9|nr:phage holin [Oenococcus oeni]EKP88807.1 phage holin [Oenococcus oeni AWRIB202]OIK76362.1 holin [Oenococcus oeni]OIK77890.1 holin [Oenococcus oeni]OIK81076.1 holin [Oenococcus oeni]OIK93831.1 holin [Oenococcus oeni]